MRLTGLTLIAAGVIAIGTRDLAELSRGSVVASDSGRTQQLLGGIAVTGGLILLTVGGGGTNWRPGDPPAAFRFCLPPLTASPPAAVSPA